MPVSCGSCDLCTNCEKSWCGRLQHKPNLVVAHKTCPDCINDVDISMHPKCETCGMRCKICGARDKKEKCYLRPPCVDTCGFRETVFRGDDTARMFCDWLFREHHKGYTVLAHNMKGYDGYFVLEYLIENSVIPKVIYAGSKIMYMHVERGLNIRMLDSLNFLPMRLANLPSAFGLTEVKKGFFPHYFNTRANQRYVGPYPAAQFYGCDTMNASDRDSFMDWYREKVETREIFDFSKELLEYCKSDVDILRKACLKFREILMTITGKEEVVLGEEGLERVVRGGVDPFNHITIASVCMQVFRSKFLKESWKVKLRSNGNLTEWLPALRMDGEFSISLDGRWISARDMQDHTIESTEFVSSPIAQVPSQGYGPYVGQYSMVSIRWLLWVQEEHFRLTGKQMYIRHALNEGEFNLAGTKYLLDGYCAETNTAYEFHGCFWHGCPLCYPQQRRKNKHVRTDQSMDELLALTFKKKKYIESLGMNYVEIWEHDFYKLLARNDSTRRFIESLDIQERLNPRESFFGGRTNAVKLHYKAKDGEKIHYLDFCSLYPSVNKYARYPIKEPTIITNNFKDIRSYFGMVKVKVLPPRKLYHPVLPQKINGKLTFALCRTCAEVQRQTTCACRDEDRSFVGVFCTPEIEKALECGYLVQKIYEVYHWEESTQFDLSTGEGGIFGEYINLFLKIKQEASGWPSWVKDEEDAMHYLGQYLEREGIKLDRQNITKNPALRAIAKLLLNSFWGKFGQRLNMPQSTFFHENEADKFFQIVSDPGKELRDFHIVSKNVLQLSWEHKDVNTREDYQTNIFVASFTTCWARLKLYEVLQTLDQRVLYFDTDSVIFVSRPGDAEPQVGSFLGQLTSELKPGEYINEFVSGGPKNYAYRTSSGTEVCKIRGFSLNHANARVLNFRSMIEMVVRPRDMSNDTLSVMNRNKINRLKRKRIIYSRPERKDYKIVYSKRVIQGDTLDTLPYGY
ncbi:uncharacterized protein LOC134258520 [Saccostrea cucullata]|uniref:uncharacterized protein LOC134258520 n=1 Tax=Saccostrea cuccullata TaxID=36930 RepID=UPI002ED04F3A